LKDDTLNHVKVADFGLAEFNRPGMTISSTSGTLSFQAPEIFNGTNYLGKD
jgi:serine/threonine protein kinase